MTFTDEQMQEFAAYVAWVADLRDPRHFDLDAREPDQAAPRWAQGMSINEVNERLDEWEREQAEWEAEQEMRYARGY